MISPWKVAKLMTNASLIHNGCIHSQTGVNITEDIWVHPVLINGGENFQRRAGWFHFIVLEPFFKVISAFATMTSGLLYAASHGSRKLQRI